MTQCKRGDILSSWYFILSWSEPD